MKNKEKLESAFKRVASKRTEKILDGLEVKARKHWELKEILIVHRYGTLRPGDQIVLVVTASSHRKDALESCQFLIDWLKTEAPFWKLEDRESGLHWVSLGPLGPYVAGFWPDSGPLGPLGPYVPGFWADSDP